VEHRRQRPPLPHGLRQPADRGTAEPTRAEQALRPQPAQQVVGAAPGPSLRGAGRAMSLRNRELANLVVVGLLTAIGFASVYIAPTGASRATSTSSASARSGC